MRSKPFYFSAVRSRCFVEAGADIIAPSDMMDGRVGAIKDAIKEMGAGNRVRTTELNRFYVPMEEKYYLKQCVTV